jgi:hypothetical protein
MAKQPMAEVFGFPISNQSDAANRYRSNKLCPFNNKVPSCTKDKANAPLGVCSVHSGSGTAITCPIRFREDWTIAIDAAEFFFPSGTPWTSLTEVRLKDAEGTSAGNIDVVLVSYDENGKLTDFGALEVQAVYISGNVRKPFEVFMEDPAGNADLDWSNEDSPRADYLSSSRKRLAPQLLFKGGILQSWGKKSAVALDVGFFNTLPTLDEVDPKDAEIAWLVYDLVLDADKDQYALTPYRKVYTKFSEALTQITVAKPGDMATFVNVLQGKLDRKLDESTPPTTATIEELL